MGRSPFQRLLGFLSNEAVYDPPASSLFLSTCLCLTHRAQCIVRFPNEVLIQPLEHELGHSLKRQRVDQEGLGLVYIGPASQ